jgi:hypothetical protein
MKRISASEKGEKQMRVPVYAVTVTQLTVADCCKRAEKPYVSAELDVLRLLVREPEKAVQKAG